MYRVNIFMTIHDNSGLLYLFLSTHESAALNLCYQAVIPPYFFCENTFFWVFLSWICIATDGSVHPGSEDAVLLSRVIWHCWVMLPGISGTWDLRFSRQPHRRGPGHQKMTHHNDDADDHNHGRWWSWWRRHTMIMMVFAGPTEVDLVTNVLSSAHFEERLVPKRYETHVDWLRCGRWI